MFPACAVRPSDSHRSFILSLSHSDVNALLSVTGLLTPLIPASGEGTDEGWKALEYTVSNIFKTTCQPYSREFPCGFSSMAKGLRGKK